jgi:hypothetical protein
MQSGILLHLLKNSVDTDTQNKLAIAFRVWIGLMTANIVIGMMKRFVTKEDAGAGATKAGCGRSWRTIRKVRARDSNR